MFHEDEVIMLAVGLAVGVYVLAQWRRLRRIPAWPLLAAAYGALLAAWVSTVLEGLLWGALFNGLEHLAHAASTVLLALWVWRRSRADGPGHSPW